MDKTIDGKHYETTSIPVYQYNDPKRCRTISKE